MKEMFPWMGLVPSQVLQQTLMDLDRAYVNFFEGRGQYPRFKRKSGSARAFAGRRESRLTAAACGCQSSGGSRRGSRGRLRARSRVQRCASTDSTGTSLCSWSKKWPLPQCARARPSAWMPASPNPSPSPMDGSFGCRWLLTPRNGGTRYWPGGSPAVRWARTATWLRNAGSWPLDVGSATG